MLPIAFDNAIFSDSASFPVSESLPSSLGDAVGSRLRDQQRDGDILESWYISGLRNGYAHIWYRVRSVVSGRWTSLEGNTTIRI